MPDLTSYSSIIFDCDGVIFNSNSVKTEAFRVVASSYGDKAANRLVDYHLEHGGVSRYEKFRYFLESVLGLVAEPGKAISENPAYKSLLHDYANTVERLLISCDVSPGLLKLKQQTADAKWFVVSGGDQAELRTLFKNREIEHLFDGGIFGSPQSKDQILSREIKGDSIKRPAIFLGDSKYDYFVSKDFNLDFIFINAWTDVIDWIDFVSINQIDTVPLIRDLVTK